jgi:hypothetical protein
LANASVRVNRQGNIDPFSSEQDARAGVAALEKELHLFRNFRASALGAYSAFHQGCRNGKWKGGDLDGEGDARGFGNSGSCAFVGHANGAGVRHAINIFKLQPNPESSRRCRSAKIPAMVEGNQGFDDRELRSLV